MGFNPYYPRTWRKDKDSESEILDKSHRSHMTGKRRDINKLNMGTLRGFEGLYGDFDPTLS